jgi:hypothetical protein
MGSNGILLSEKQRYIDSLERGKLIYFEALVINTAKSFAMTK